MTQNIKKLLLAEIALFLAVGAPLLKVYFFNRDYFDLSFVEVLISVSSLFLVAGSLLALLMMCFWKFKDYFEGVVSGVLVASVLSTFLLPVSLRALSDGNARAFEPRYAAFFVLASAITVFLVLAYITSANTRFRSICGKAVVASRFIGVAYITIFFLYTLPYFEDWFEFTGARTSLPQQVGLSRDKNIFVLSFDQVQGSVMRGYFKNFPSSAEIFDGFTFYADTSSTYPNTNYSLSSTLMGRITTVGLEEQTWAVNQESSILAKAELSGFDPFVVRWPDTHRHPCFFCSDSKFKNASEFNLRQSFELTRHAFNLAFGVDISKVATKLKLFNDERFVDDPGLLDVLHLWQLDMHYLQALSDNFSVADTRPTIFFMHFFGTHQPFIYEKHCSLKPANSILASQNIAGAIDELTCMVSFIDNFLSKLKELGIYDNSLIFIISDHGYEIDINNFSKSPEFVDYFYPSSGALGDPRNVKPSGSYNPMFLYKPLDQRGNLATSHELRSTLDVAATICNHLQACSPEDFEGFSLDSEVPPGRTRPFWIYIGGREDTSEYHEGLEEHWELRAFSGSIEPNLALAMGVDERSLTRSFALGDRLLFQSGLVPSSDWYILEGWSAQESEHRWTDGKSAAMSFSLGQYSGGSVIFSIYLVPFLGGGAIAKQDVKVSVNDRYLLDWHVDAGGRYKVLIPADLIETDGSLRVELDISHPISPLELGISKDPRKLGVAAVELEILPGD